jgi:hypothetical protein
MFAKSTRPGELFAAVALELNDPSHVAKIEALCEAYRPRADGDIELDYYVACAKQLREDHAAAFKMFREMLPRAPQDEHDHYVMMMLDAGAQAKMPIDAYRAAPDASEAFNYLADMLAGSETLDQLRQLLELHRQNKPDDPWLAFYTARSLALSGESAAADAAFAECMKSADEHVCSSARSAWVAARFDSGDAAGAYRDIEPKDETFEQLCNLSIFHERPEALRQVLQLHRESGADERQLLWWDAQLAWLVKDYPRTIELLERFLAEHTDSDQSHALDQFIRSLVRSGQAERAAAIARDKSDQIEPLLRCLAYVAAADAAAVRVALEQCLEDGWELSDLYEDEDLGPLLRSPAMHEIRQHFPPPATQRS